MDTPVKKILVTGSRGLVGSAAVDYFLKEGWKVVGIDTNMRSKFFGTPWKGPEGGDHPEVDIRDEKAVNELFALYCRAQGFDAIIHAAAQPSHDYSKEHVIEDFDINARGTVILLEAARKYCPEAVFVHCSTDKIYGEGMVQPIYETETRWDAMQPFDELTPIEPALSPFGVSKLYADFIVQEYAAQGWLKTGVFRMGCITGRKHEGAEQHGFLAYLAKCVKEGKTYKIYGYKGKQVRDQIHAHDLVRAFAEFIKKPSTVCVYNMGGGPARSISVLEAGAAISERVGKPFISEYIEEPRFGDRVWDVHDVSKFRAQYPAWDYQYSLEDIISDLCVS